MIFIENSHRYSTLLKDKDKEVRIAWCYGNFINNYCRSASKPAMKDARLERDCFPLPPTPTSNAFPLGDLLVAEYDLFDKTWYIASSNKTFIHCRYLLGGKKIYIRLEKRNSNIYKKFEYSNQNKYSFCFINLFYQLIFNSRNIYLN